MTNKTELAELKHYLFDAAGARMDTTVTDANVLISEANMAAYESLPPAEQAIISGVGRTLQAKIAERNPRAQLGDAGQLELIAAIGAVLNEIGGSDEIHS